MPPGWLRLERAAGVSARLRIWLAPLLAVLAALAMWLLVMQRDASSGKPVARMTVAVPLQLSGGAMFIARERKLFAAQGVEVEIQPHQLGKQALQSVIDGKAELALVADTPFMLAVLKGQPIATVSAVFESRKVMAVLARSERGIHKPADLAGKTVGTLAGTNAQFFLDTVLSTHGIRDAKTVNLEPQQLAAALRAGSVDAITVWMPELASLQREFGERAVTLYAEDLFVYRFLLAGRKEYIETHADAVRRLLEAVDTANRVIREEPTAARTIIGKAIGLAPDLLAHDFRPGDFTVGLDQSLLIALDDQTRWALGRGLVPGATAPNYLDFVRQRPLEAVRPDAIKIIH
jgi:ABC-type nitrate/sulfonate/bicarbonate transport system substrate-binding protein